MRNIILAVIIGLFLTSAAFAGGHHKRYYRSYKCHPPVVVKPTPCHPPVVIYPRPHQYYNIHGPYRSFSYRSYGHHSHGRSYMRFSGPRGHISFGWRSGCR